MWNREFSRLCSGPRYGGVKSPGTRLRVRMIDLYRRLVAAKAIEQGLYCRDVGIHVSEC